MNRRIRAVGAKPWFFCLLAGLLLSAPAVLAAEPAPAGPAEAAARLLPGDTIFFLLIKDVNSLKENAKKTSMYGLYKDPAMQAFVAPAEKKVNEFIDGKLKEAWKEAGLENPPESLPWPEGRVILGVRLDMVTRQVPKMEWSGQDNEPPKVVGTEDRKSPEPRLVLLADMGANAEKARTLIQQLAEKAVEKGYKRTQESLRGLDIEVLTPPKQAVTPDGAPAVQRSDPVAWAFKDKTLLLGTGLKMLEDVAVRLSATDQESLADDKGFQGIMKKLSADQADGCCFLGVKALIRFLTEQAAEKDESREDPKKIVAALGLDNVSGLGAAASLAPNEKENVRMSLLIGVDGQKRGLMELLSPAPLSAGTAALATRDVSSFFAINLDPGRAYDQVLKMVREAGGEEQAERVKQVMMMKTDDPNAEPIDLRKEVLGQLAGPITLQMHTFKAAAAPGGQKMLFAVAVRDGAALDNALGRFHARLTDKMPVEMKKDLKQELLNANIYVMPGRNPLEQLMAPRSDDEPAAEEKNPLAFAVAGQQLVIGGLDLVQQGIRDARRDKEKSEGLQADPMYDYASKFLPAQAGGIVYGNQQIAAEMFWTQIKEAAKASAKAPAAAPGGDDPAPRRPPQRNPGPPVNPLNPMSAVVEMLKAYCDFTALPDFSAVKQYFGAEVTYVISNEDGILIESRNLRPPAK
jgi:hypothetical protein